MFTVVLDVHFFTPFRSRLFTRHSTEGFARFSSSLCAFYEVFSDYDPFLGHCAPSNPWLTSDTDRWDLMQPLWVVLLRSGWRWFWPWMCVEWTIPLSFVSVVGHSTAKNSSVIQRVFASSWSFAKRNSPPRAWISTCTCKKSATVHCRKSRRKQMSSIGRFTNEFFLSSLSLSTVNIWFKMLRKKWTSTIRSERKSSNTSAIPLGQWSVADRPFGNASFLRREIFAEAEKHIIELMKKNSYPRFIQSEYYRNLLQNAPNPVPKKT